ncbi:MAG: glycosyltransferase [Pirellulales bacterium]
MPCKNPKVTFFREAVDSVLSQSSPNWNLIVIDDHSSDPFTLEMLCALNANSDPRVSVVSNVSMLITGALNTGMEHASTPFVCSLHCDDLLDRQAVECLNHYILQYPEHDYFHSSRVYIDENGIHISDVHSANDTFDLSDFVHGGPIKSLHCWRINSALALGGMDESLGLHGADDYDFSWCMAESGCSFKAIPECLYYIRDHRMHYRLTTHVPLDVQIDALKKIWKKHGVTEMEIAKQIKKRSAGYLQQSLYINNKDRKQKEKEKYDIRQGWRQTYRRSVSPHNQENS